MFASYRDLIESKRNAAFANGVEWDGRAEWQPMKKSLSEEPIVATWSSKVFSPEREALYRDVMALEEFDADGITNELHHFIMQCVRIPKLDKPSKRKIIQIALNIGQLKSEIHVHGASGIEHLYARFNELGMSEISAYVDIDI